jgi:hypothetical protein
MRRRHPAQSAKHQHCGSTSEAESQAGFLNFSPAGVNDALDDWLYPQGIIVNLLF